jgi:S1-C subfamily serine protease
VSLLDLNSEERRARGIEFRAGVLIQRVLEDSPARRAGLAGGEIILAVGTRMVADAKGVQQQIRAAPPDTSLALEILKGRRRVNVPVVPAKPTASP